MDLLQYLATFFCLVAGSVCALLSIKLRRAVKPLRDVQSKYRIRPSRGATNPVIDTTATDIKD